MIELRTLGQIEIVASDGRRLQSVLAQPKRFALLAYLALATPRGAHRRDTLVGLFWPELDQARGRAALRKAVHYLRQSLGEGVLVGDDALELAPGVIRCDAVEFEEALAEGRPADALALYHGDLLPGLYLSEAAGFERWLDAERTRLRRRAAEAASSASASALAEGDADRAVELARRALDLGDGDERAFQRLASLLDGIGDRAGALRAYEQYRQWLADELGLTPSPETEELIAAIRGRTEPDADRPVAAQAASAAGGLAATAAAAGAPAAVTPPDSAGALSTLAPQPAAAASISPAAVTPGMPAVAPHPPPARRRQRVLQRLLVGGALAIVAMAVVAFILTGRSAADVGAPAWVIVADVENGTGESVFERSVPYALAVGLDQSPRLYVLPPERIRQALVRMRRPDADSVLDEALARDIARREGVRFVVVPMVERAGDRYEVAARLVDPESAATLAVAAVHADHAADVIGALDRLAKRLRREAGESALAVARSSTPLPRVTTASLAALEKFASGARAFNASRWEEARRLWEDAVAIDSAFAAAHASLGMHAYWTNRPEAGEAHFARALAHADDLPERERKLIRARIESWRGNREESTALLRALYIEDSTDIEVLHRLGYDYLRLGRFRESREVYRRIVAFDSLVDNAWINLATVEKRLELYDSALAHYRRAFALAPALLTENSNLNLEFGGTYVLAGMPDSAAALFRLQVRSSDRDTRARGLRSLALLAMYRGRYGEAAGLLTEAADLSRATGALLSELRNRLLLATAFAQRGMMQEAAAQLDTCFARAVDARLAPTFVYWLGKALARTGDARRARTLLEGLEARALPESSTLTAALEGLRGEVLLASAEAGGGDAGDQARAALPHFERALLADSTGMTLESLAHAVLVAGDLDRALRLYSELDATPEFGWEAQEYWRMAPYWLGRIHERRGEPAEAARSYTRFLDSWIEAEPVLPVLADARDRLDRLQRSETRR